MTNPSASNEPVKITLPKITGLTTAFPIEIEIHPEGGHFRQPGRESSREARRHESGR